MRLSERLREAESSLRRGGDDDVLQEDIMRIFRATFDEVIQVDTGMCLCVPLGMLFHSFNVFSVYAGVLSKIKAAYDSHALPKDQDRFVFVIVSVRSIG